MSDIIKDALKERIKQHEGYRLDTYIDTLGFKTGGYGHKMLPGEEPPKDKDPVSPIKIFAGGALNHKKPRHEPMIAPQKIEISPVPSM